MMLHRRTAFALTAAALLTTMTLAAGCSFLPKEEEEAAPALAAPVKSEKATYTVKRGSIQDKVSLRATIAPVQNQDLFYRNGGRVKAVYVKAGDKVKAGAVLAELFSDDAEYQLAQARIRLERSQLALADAQRRYGFTRTEAVENEVKRAELDLQSAELDVDRYGSLVADARLTAPFNGQIMSTDVKPGDQVAGYQNLITIADPASLWVEADVDDSQLLRLAVGMKAQLNFSDVSGMASGVVVELPDPAAKAKAPNAPKRIKVRPDSLDAKAAMGMVGKVDVIMQEKKDVLLLESAGVRRFSNRTYVTMKEPRREKDVTTGIESDNLVEIVSGLKEGDVVIGR
jgi:macrolide-specific efflux system membrane fusion protein